MKDKSTKGMKGNREHDIKRIDGFKVDKKGMKYSNNFAEDDLEFEVKNPQKVMKQWDEKMVIHNKLEIIRKLFPKWSSEQTWDTATKQFHRLDPYTQYYISQEL